MSVVLLLRSEVKGSHSQLHTSQSLGVRPYPFDVRVLVPLCSCVSMRPLASLGFVGGGLPRGGPPWGFLLGGVLPMGAVLSGGSSSPS